MDMTVNRPVTQISNEELLAIIQQAEDRAADLEDEERGQPAPTHPGARRPQ